MRVLLVSTNLLCDPVPVYPLGVGYLISSLEKAGHICSVFDFIFEKDPEINLLQKIRDFQPKILGFSIRNVDNICYLFQKEFISQIGNIIKSCRKITDIYIVLGGSGFSIFPEEIMKLFQADFGIIGEGERVLAELAACLDHGKCYQKIPGLLYKNGTGYNINQPNLAYHNFSTVSPDRGIYEGKYSCTQKTSIKDMSVFSIQSKRGCQFSCIYCTYPIIEGRCIRIRPVKDVAEELQKMAEKHNVKKVDFVDSVFNYPLDHAKDICRAICQLPVKIQWTCFLHPSSIDEELAELMVDGGCVHAELGVDSLAGDVLSALRKGFCIDDVYRSVQILKNRGLDFTCSLIFGAPNETMSTVRETIGNLERLDPYAVFGLIGMRIYPNTELARNLIAEGILDQSESLLKPKFYVSPTICLESMKEYLSNQLNNHSNWNIIGLKRCDYAARN